MAAHLRTARGIPFSAPMVRALLDGRKTQTRRLVKHQPEWRMVAGAFYSWTFRQRRGRDSWLWPNAAAAVLSECPYGVPGDLLWVRETWCYATDPFAVTVGVGYRADKSYRFLPNGDPSLIPDGSVVWNVCNDDFPGNVKWRPGIHMPKWAARIWLEIVEVRCQRLQEISEEDAKAEGMEFHDGDGVGHSGWRHSRDHGFVYASAISAFAAAWESIHGPGSWERDKEKWVWAITFKPADPEQAAHLRERLKERRG